MKNLILFILFAFLGSSAFSQYYYSDILETKRTNQLYKLLQANQFKSVSATSFEGREPSNDFILEQTVSEDGRQITTRSAALTTGESFFNSFYKGNRLIKSIDSSTNATNTVSYEYDNTGKIIEVSSISKDVDGRFVTTEKHLWSYNQTGAPEKMLKVKNSADTTTIVFDVDEKGNVTEERWMKNNRNFETYYYYYTPKSWLTDIVRFNKKVKTMLPDYTFDYDNTGRIAQMTQTQHGTGDYLIWKYTYSENGLKEKEFVFNKQKEPLGRIEYRYR